MGWRELSLLRLLPWPAGAPGRPATLPSLPSTLALATLPEAAVVPRASHEGGVSAVGPHPVPHRSPALCPVLGEPRAQELVPSGPFHRPINAVNGAEGYVMATVFRHGSGRAFLRR